MASDTTANDDEPAGGILRWMATRVLGVVIIAGLVGLAASVLASSRTPRYSSTAKIAFIEDTRFDYVDAERDRLIGFTYGDDGQSITSQDGVLDVEFVRPDLQTFFDVEVIADSPELAAAAANELASLVIAGDLSQRSAPIEREIEALRARNELFEAQLADLDEATETAAEVEARAESTRFGGDAATLEALTIELREAQDDRSVAVRVRNQMQEVRIASDLRISDLEIERDVANAETRIVQPAVAPTERDDLSNGLIALLAMLGTLGLGTAAVFLAAPYRREVVR